MAYVIRKAKLEDIDAINELLYQVHELHVKIRPDLFVDGVKKYTDKHRRTLMDLDGRFCLYCLGQEDQSLTIREETRFQYVFHKHN